MSSRAVRNSLGSAGGGGSIATQSTASTDYPNSSIGGSLHPVLRQSLSEESFGPIAKGGTKSGGTTAGQSVGGTNGIVSLSYAAVGKSAPSTATANGPTLASLPSEPSSFLVPLNDEHSTYASVARACLALNQYAGSGSCTPSPPLDFELGAAHSSSTCSASSALFHEASYANSTSNTLHALATAATSHTDRRCRIVATKTLALVARSAYARLAPSSLLFSVRAGTCAKLEDETANDVPVTLVTIALEEEDEGVSSCALEALGILLLHHPGYTYSTEHHDDVLTKHIQSIATCSPSPHSPSYSLQKQQQQQITTDSSYQTSVVELQQRVFENILPQRIRRILHRVALYKTSGQRQNAIIRALPIMTAAIAHLVRTSPSRINRISNSTIGSVDAKGVYAKRWYEMDAWNIVQEFVDMILVPCMVDGIEVGVGNVGDGSGGIMLGHAAALSAMRMVEVCSHGGGGVVWVDRVCKCSLASLINVVRMGRQQYAVSAGGSNGGRGNGGGVMNMGIEGKVGVLATLLIALRGVRVEERSEGLAMMFEEMKSLPATCRTPGGSGGVVSAGLLLADGMHVRRSVRIGLWTEIALSVLLPCHPAAGSST